MKISNFSRIIRKVMLCLGFLCAYTSLSAQLAPSKQSDRTIGGSFSDSFTSMISTADGGYLLGCSSASNISGDKSENSKGNWDYWIVKIDSSSNKQWDKTFGGGDYDQLTSMVATPDGGYLLGGISWSNISGDKSENSKGYNDYWVVKIDANGNKLWDKTFGGSNFEGVSSLVTTADGGYLLGGGSDSNISGDKSENNKGGSNDYWIVKIDSLGNKLWDKTLGGNNYDYLSFILKIQDNGYLLGGTSQSNISGDKSESSKGYNDYWIVKIDVNGNKLWDKTIGGNGESNINGEIIRSILSTTDGGYLLGGSSDSNISGDKSENSKGSYDYWIVKTDSLGNKQWDKTLGGSNWDNLTSTITTSDGGYLLGGFSDSNISADKSENNKGQLYTYDYWIVKVDSLGNKIWDKTFGGNANDESSFILAKSDSIYILGGSSDSNISGDKSENSEGGIDCWIVKLAKEIDNPNKLSGTVFHGQNANCIQEVNEIGLAGWTIKAQSSTTTYYTVSDTLGKYTLYLDKDTYTLTQIPPAIYAATQTCPTQPYTITFDGYGKDTSGFNFALDVTECAVLKVDISANRRLRCFQGQTYLTYRNEGITTAENVEIQVDFPEYTIPLSSSLPWTSKVGNTLKFNIGTLAAGEFGQISITDSIACVLPDLGATQCTQARITPKNTCLPTNSNWNGASLTLQGECLILFDPVALISLKNAGTGNMTDSTAFRIFANADLIYEGKVKLNKGDSLAFEIPTQGMSIRVEADQVAFHPSNQQVSVNVEGCGLANDTISTGFVNQFPQNDENFETETDCQTIVGSYDPNDKLVSPEGITENHYVKPNSRLEYTIRFQNTGTAEAINIEVVDTLSNDLNMESFEMMSTSHPYTLEIRGGAKQTLIFKFKNINLPDSTSNEPESHGFIKFKISPKAGLPEGTIVENFGDIYFDFNEPIRTNTTVSNFTDYQFPVSTAINKCDVVGVAPKKPSIAVATQDTLRSSEIGEKYEWFLNGTTLSFNTRSIKANESGNYEVKVTRNGCVSAKSAIFAYTITALNEFERLSKVQIFPNPTQGKLQIRMENPLDKTVTLTLTNATGTVVWQHTYKTNTQDEWKEELNFGGFGKGLYSLQIQNSKGFSVKKVVLE